MREAVLIDVPESVKQSTGGVWLRIGNARICGADQAVILRRARGGQV